MYTIFALTRSSAAALPRECARSAPSVSRWLQQRCVSLGEPGRVVSVRGGTSP